MNETATILRRRLCRCDRQISRQAVVFHIWHDIWYEIIHWRGRLDIGHGLDTLHQNMLRKTFLFQFVSASWVYKQIKNSIFATNVESTKRNKIEETC